ncbi:pyridoxal-phosphate dependent enzyme [Streptomyces sp. NPDC101165]|uniref:pyridoxal-phosphate dependent enzyme n=1 Tax=Streptomyces sp. NPDC101165 TaxID=3366119 RepID=UPI0038105B56
MRDFHAYLPAYAPTSLTELPALAAESGVGRVFVKDESCRLGPPAFKALGASWAVHRVPAERAAQDPGTGPVTLVGVTDGNHGRAVARVARLLEQRAHIVVPRGPHPDASPGRAPRNAVPHQASDRPPWPSCRAPGERPPPRTPPPYRPRETHAEKGVATWARPHSLRP